MILEVNMPGMVPGEIRVDNAEDADRVFSVLVDAQNIPGVGEFETARLVASGRVVWVRRFNDYY